MGLVLYAIVLGLSVAVLTTAAPAKRECIRKSPSSSSSVQVSTSTSASTKPSASPSSPSGNGTVSALDISALLPRSFVNPDFRQSRDTITSYGVKSIQSLIDRSSPSTGELVPGGGWGSQVGFHAMANWDYLHQTRDFYDEISQGQAALAKANTWFDTPLADEYNDDNGWAGSASLKAYQAYGDEVFLTRAKGIWQSIYDHGLVKQSDIGAGHLVGTKFKTTKLSAQCDGKSMTGGVYWMNGKPSDPSSTGAGHPGLGAVSTGNFALLGAELCAVTKDTRYCDVAKTSLAWIDTFMVIPDGDSKGLIWDNIDGNTCEVTKWTFTYNAGLYIGAYALLGHLRSDSSAIDLAKRTVLASMQTTAPWNAANGVMKEGQGDASGADDGIFFRAILVRGLLIAHPYMPPDVQAAIVEYVNIQYFSLVNNDSNDPEAPVEYGRNWPGPFSVSTRQSQIVALDVLNALILNADTAFPPTSTKGAFISASA